MSASKGNDLPVGQTRGEAPKLPARIIEDPKQSLAKLDAWKETFRTLAGENQKVILKNSEQNLKQLITDCLELLNAYEPNKTEYAVDALYTICDFDFLDGQQIRIISTRLREHWDKADNEFRSKASRLIGDLLYVIRVHPDTSLQPIRDELFQFLVSKYDRHGVRPLQRAILTPLMVSAGALQDDQIESLRKVVADDPEVSENPKSTDEETRNFWEIGQEFLAQVVSFENFKKLFDASDPSAPIINVMSRKGGVGKTVLVLYLAMKLAAEGKKVAVIDMDYGGPAFPYLFRCRGRPGVPINQILLPTDPDDDDHSFIDDLDKVEYLPENIDPKKYGKNISIFQMSVLPYLRHQFLVDALAPQSLSRLAKRTRTLLSALTKKFDLILIDNHPGFLGPQLVSLSVATRAKGLTLFVTTPDIIDIGGLELEIDLLRSVLLGAQNAGPDAQHETLSFVWVLNRVPKDPEIAALFTDKSHLAHALRNHPALDLLPGLDPQKIVRRYMNLPNPVIVARHPRLMDFFIPGKLVGQNVDFSPLIEDLDTDLGISEIMTRARKLAKRDLAEES